MSEQLTRSSKHIQKALKKQKAYKRATAVAGTSMILAPVVGAADLPKQNQASKHLLMKSEIQQQPLPIAMICMLPS